MTALARRPRSHPRRALTSASPLVFAALLGIPTAVLLDGCSPGPRRVADRPRDPSVMARPSPPPVDPIPFRRSTSRPLRSEDWARVLDAPSAGVAPTMVAKSRLLRGVHTHVWNDRVRPSSYEPDRLPQPVDPIPRDPIPEPEPVAFDPVDDDPVDIDPEDVVGANALDTDPAEVEIDPRDIIGRSNPLLHGGVDDEAMEDPGDELPGGDSVGGPKSGLPDGLPRGGPPGGGGSPVGGILDILKKAVGLGGSDSSLPTPPPTEDATDTNDVESNSGADPRPSGPRPAGGAAGNGGFKNVEPANDSRADAILKKLGSQGRLRAAAVMKKARLLYEAGDYDAAKKTALEAHALHPAIASEVEALIQQIERSASRG